MLFDDVSCFARVLLLTLLLFAFVTSILFRFVLKELTHAGLALKTNIYIYFLFVLCTIFL